MHLINVSPESLFEALADATRLRIVRLLAVTREECCLCELVDSLREPQYKLSKHVKILRQVGLLSAEREGRWVYHRLVEGPDYLKSVHQLVQSLPDPGGVYRKDLKHFRNRMCLREGGRCRVGIQTFRLAAAR